MPLYASAEQIMRDRSELARKGIARGRSVVVLTYSGGVVFVAENQSTALHKVSEIYNRIGFAAVGRYNEFEMLRVAGIRHTDVKGYTYDPRDVTGRELANWYAQILGSIFSEQMKPYEVELCIAEVAQNDGRDQLYHLTYDGSIVDQPDFVVMGGQADAITAVLRDSYQSDMALADTVRVAVNALGSAGGNGAKRALGVGELEVAVLERTRARRTFRRITGAALRQLLPGDAKDSSDGSSGAAEQQAQSTGEQTQSTGEETESTGARTESDGEQAQSADERGAGSSASSEAERSDNGRGGGSTDSA